MGAPMLEIQGLSVRVAERMVLRGVDLCVEAGETLAVFGPNGSGKTTLLCAILGFPGCAVTAGRVLFKGRDVTGQRTDERARLGMGMAFQRPPSVRGVHLGDLLALSLKSRGEDPGGAAAFLDRLNLRGFAGRDLNRGFSGGEIKRSELAQLLAQGPDLLLFDEPDSGVDLVSIDLVAAVMNDLLQKSAPPGERARSGLVVTHTGHILDRVRADRGCVLLNGAVSCTGEAAALLEDIRTLGYEGCAACRRAV